MFKENIINELLNEVLLPAIRCPWAAGVADPGACGVLARGCEIPLVWRGRDLMGRLGHSSTRKIYFLYLPSRFSPPQFLKCRNNAKDLIHTEIPFGNVYFPAPSLPGDPKGDHMGLHLPSEGTVGTSPKLSGSMGFPREQNT